MAVIKNTLLFAGWIPTLFGGGVAVWWWESDKTIKDALSRTGLSFLKSEEDFQKVYYQFEDDDSFLEDIPDSKTLEGKAISKWCEEKLKLPLTEENIKESLPKATKYCLGNKKISSGVPRFNNFKNIFELMNKDGVNTSSGIVQMVHLGNEPTEDVYYLLNDEGDLQDSNWKNASNSRDRAFQKKIYIPEEYGPLDLKIHQAVGNQQLLNKWQSVVNKFVDAPQGEKIEGINILKKSEKPDLFTIGDLVGGCTNLFKKTYDLDQEEQYKSDKKRAIHWCTENGREMYK